MLVRDDRWHRYGWDSNLLPQMCILLVCHPQGSATYVERTRFPLPHPADSEYRFDNPTAQRLAAQLVSQTKDGDEILLVGTPTVALAIADLQVDRRIRFVGARSAKQACD